ncbi:HAMP domain-containing sensor histidine kinase [Demequina sp. SYSU T00192]|uniref:histidine kinase n=1 Tax=Demequina litoralis TaxID=3051660 RepID=A0ABT8GA68_9MICO|nr:HAMP domain-containing sensor histidine kinase [Demequina sp. SYSU T00192]MDN4476036.1 HAMP domain-containing sensor histidine kinase [Demequina sp. SYSU T00192]
MRTVRARLLASHLAVAAVGVLALVAVGTVVANVTVERRMGMTRGAMMGQESARELLADALPVALGWGAAAGLAAAAAAALLMTRRIAGPLAAIREATRAIAAGDYTRRVPRPPEEELAAVAADVDALAARLAEGEARRVRLIDEVAHEMRTPLTTIRGSMEGLIDGVVDASPEVYERVAAEAARLQRLAEDLSTLSRAEESALTLRPAPTDLATLVREAAARLQPQFEHRGVTLEVSAGAAPTVSVDRDRIAQVLVNLLGNALAHSTDGGRVRVSVDAGAHDAAVEVADEGDGIAPEEIDRVFERFYRGPGSGERPGRGIGLTIARSLARAHGGDVTARSPGRGRGATFVLTLPRAPEA